jgi:death-on-curing protein
VIFLSLADLVHVAERTLGSEVQVRDYGLLQSAVVRPQTSVFGEDAYPTLEAKAAALLHSLARNRALVDGNKRLALAATLTFLGVNGRRLTMSNDQAYDFVIAVAVGELSEVEGIAEVIRRFTETLATWVSPRSSG